MLMTDTEIAQVAHHATRAARGSPDEPPWEALPELLRDQATGMTRALRAQPAATVAQLFPAYENEVASRVFTAVVRALDA